MFNIADLEHVSEIFTRLLFFIMALPVSSEICSKKSWTSRNPLLGTTGIFSETPRSTQA